MKLKSMLLIILILPGLATTLSAEKMPKNVNGIDTPTAFTLNRGVYYLALTAYDNGGIEFKTFIGLTKFFYFGVSLDIQNVIGKDTIQFNIPGVVAKLKIIQGTEKLPLSISIGYDSFYLGYYGTVENELNSLDRMVYGAYLVFTYELNLFGSSQFISAGVRVPMQPWFVPNNSSYFAGIDIPFIKELRLKFEIERMYWNFRQPEDWLFNLGLRYTYMRKLSLEFSVIFQYNQIPNRILKIIYHDRF